jgi:hypothetical protein
MLKEPAFEVLSSPRDAAGAGRHLRLHLRSPRGAPSLAVAIPRARGVRWTVEGHEAYPRAIGDLGVLGLLAVPPEGIVVELEAEGAEPIAFTLLDRSFGVPQGTKAETAIRARTDTRNAAPSQDGDVTVVTRAISL